MTWRRPGDRPLSETTMVRLLTHICVTRPQWVKREEQHIEIPLGKITSINHQMKQSPHRFPAIGWLSFMRYVSFTVTGLFLRWTLAETLEAILAKLLSGCDSATCRTNCKARHSKVYEMLKKTCNFQTDWMLCILANAFAVMLSATPNPRAPVVDFWSLTM